MAKPRSINGIPWDDYVTGVVERNIRPLLEPTTPVLDDEPELDEPEPQDSERVKELTEELDMIKSTLDLDSDASLFDVLDAISDLEMKIRSLTKSQGQGPEYIDA